MAAEAQGVPEWQERIANTVRLLLAHQHRTQRELASAIELTSSQLSRSMSGDIRHRREWRVPDLYRIAEFFSVSAGDLLTGDLQRLLASNGKSDEPVNS